MGAKQFAAATYHLEHMSNLSSLEQFEEYNSVQQIDGPTNRPTGRQTYRWTDRPSRLFIIYHL